MAAREKRGASPEGRRTPPETVEIVTIVVSSPHVRQGTDKALAWEKRRMDRTALQEQIRYVERRLAAAGEDKQMATLELQKTTQKRSQFLNKLSNAMKAMNQVTMSVIRNLGS